MSSVVPNYAPRLHAARHNFGALDPIDPIEPRQLEDKVLEEPRLIGRFHNAGNVVLAPWGKSYPGTSGTAWAQFWALGLPALPGLIREYRFVGTAQYHPQGTNSFVSMDYKAGIVGFIDLYDVVGYATALNSGQVLRNWTPWFQNVNLDSKLDSLDPLWLLGGFRMNGGSGNQPQMAWLSAELYSRYVRVFVP